MTPAPDTEQDLGSSGGVRRWRCWGGLGSGKGMGSVVRRAGWGWIPEGCGSGKMTNPDFTMGASR